MACNIGIPVERYLQITQLAKRNGTSIVDVVSDFVNAAITAGHLPDALPRWVIARSASEVVFECSDSAIRRCWNPTVARKVAATLEHLSEPATVKKRSHEPSIDLTIERRGPGVLIVCNETGASRVVARSVAADIARLLRKAAEETQP